MSRRKWRLLLCGAVAAVSGVLALGAEAAGLGWFPDEVSETDRVEARIAAGRERIRLNQALTDDLIVGRVGLWDASDRLLAINGDDPGHRTVLDRWFPAPTPEASAAANLIVRVHDRLKDDPALRRSSVRRLLADYQVRYPEPDREWLRQVEEDLVEVPSQ